MQISKSHKVDSAILGIYRLLMISFVFIIFYFAQTIVIPLTTAALLTFLLSPLVTKLERWIGNIFSILLVVILVFSLIGLGGYFFTKQLVPFGANIQNYNENIQAKFKGFSLPDWEIFKRIGQAFDNLKNEIFGESTEATSINTTALPVKLVDLSSNFISLVESFFGSFISILGSTGLIFLLVIFMLLNRDDLRGRMIKLVGQRRISSTTNAMDDASDRVYGYLYRLLVVNMGFGICVTAGLYFIGLPNSALWGCLAAILRFIPYIGPWIAAIIPIILSFMITETWTVPLLTLSFFLVLELVTAYVVEPFYYGVGTGVSSFALILAAIFWTWLWGPIGLLLSTPLTVCLVVIGQHVPNMNFLSVLLSQEKALTPVEECYHKLLSFDSSESIEIVEAYLKKNSLTSLYDSVLIPIVVQTELDFHLESIDAEKKEGVYQGIRDVIEFLSMSEQKDPLPVKLAKESFFCLPIHAIRDEIGVNILTQFLAYESFNVSYTIKHGINDLFELIEERKPDVVFVVGVAPLVLSHARYLCTKIHQKMPTTPIFMGLWGGSSMDSEVRDQLISAGASRVIFSLNETLEVLHEMRSSIA